VPVNPSRLRRPRRDMLFVSLAGPATNFLLALAAALLARWLVGQGQILATSFRHPEPDLLVEIVFYFSLINLLLGLFNLLPIPPLDGSALIERVLPADWLPHWYRFRPYGILVLFGLVFFTGVIDTIISPFFDALIDFVLA
jgi:Zn-dependent protease